MSFWTPEIATDDFLERGKFVLAWRLTILFCSVFTILTIVFSVGTHEELITYIICTVLATGSLVYLHYTKKSNVIYWFLAFAGTAIAAFTLNVYAELVHYGDFFWMILIIAFSFFGLGKKAGLLFLVLNVGSILTYIYMSLNNNIELLEPVGAKVKFALAVELIVALVCISYVIYQFVSIHNLAYSQLLKANTQLVERNQTIENQNNEKTTLVKEIHHRVKNNLQIIISLLRLQKNELKSAESKKQFSEAINRIMVMSLIHRRLYQGGDLAKVKIQSYLQELADDIKSLSETGFKTKIKVTSDIEKVGLKTIVPLGLLINELVSNSIKHAFSDEQSCEIKVIIKEEKDPYFSLTYHDNGCWKEPKDGSSSFGLELIKILTEQMDGTHERQTNEGGTNYSFSLKNIDLEK